MICNLKKKKSQLKKEVVFTRFLPLSSTANLQSFVVRSNIERCHYVTGQIMRPKQSGVPRRCHQGSLGHSDAVEKCAVLRPSQSGAAAAGQHSYYKLGYLLQPEDATCSPSSVTETRTVTNGCTWTSSHIHPALF